MFIQLACVIIRVFTHCIMIQALKGKLALGSIKVLASNDLIYATAQANYMIQSLLSTTYM